MSTGRKRRVPQRSRAIETAVVRVPGSTSNLGPGFDCLGVALRLYNDVLVSRSGASNSNSMVRETAHLFFERADVAPFRFSCSISGDVPRSRGLGSSVTVRLGVLHALNRLAGGAFSSDELFGLGTELEGHPDNAAPATYGGFTVARSTSVQRFSVSARLKFVLLVPVREVGTSDARSVLPEQIVRADAVASCGNACAITAAFASGEYEKLRGAFVDGLHQPFRDQLNPGMQDIIAAGEAAGALGGFLSGSGSTIACVTLREPIVIAKAMQSASASRNARVVVTTADNRGVRIVDSK